MSYVTGQYEVTLAKTAVFTSTGDVSGGVWAPGMTPHFIRAVAVVVVNAFGDPAVLKLDKRPTAGDDTGRGDGDVAVISIPTGTALGKVVYKNHLNVEILPGEEVVAEVTDAGASGDAAHVILFVEPRWEEPGNNTDMIASA